MRERDWEYGWLLATWHGIKKSLGISSAWKQGWKHGSRSVCPGQVNFANENRSSVVQWAHVISLSSLVCLNENVSFINYNLQSEAISKRKTARLVNH